MVKNISSTARLTQKTQNVRPFDLPMVVPYRVMVMSEWKLGGTGFQESEITAKMAVPLQGVK